MARVPLIISLSLSIALVGGASFVRLFQKTEPESGLLAVNQGLTASLEDNSYLMDEFLAPAATSTVPTNRNLSQADTISRRLFSEYISLSSKKSGSSANILNLAQKYVSTISENNLDPKKLSLYDLIVVPDSKENVVAYSNAVSAVRAKYGAIVSMESGREDLSDIESPGFSSFMGKVSEIYEASANELSLIKVPYSLAQNHIELVNNYFETSRATETISQISADPVAAYAALNSYAHNTDQEDALLLKIQLALVNAASFNGNGI